MGFFYKSQHKTIRHNTNSSGGQPFFIKRFKKLTGYDNFCIVIRKFWFKCVMHVHNQFCIRIALSDLPIQFHTIMNNNDAIFLVVTLSLILRMRWE